MKTIKLGMNGACGRMGMRILGLANEDNGFVITHALEHENHPLLGKDIGEVVGFGDIGVKVSNTMDADNIDVLIDFSSPVATTQRVKECAANGIGVVIGTTGLDESQKNMITEESKKTACLLAPNMSIGVNLLFDLIAQVSKTLGKETDIEIIETHHKLKKDAPSGTALKMAETVCENAGLSMKENVIYGRQGQVGERKKNEVGVHAVRLGDTIGIHRIVFDGTDECIEITHDAHSRDAFASGALKAAKFIAQCDPGFYSMADVLKNR